MRAVCPLPIREDWTPSYLTARGDANRDFAFNLRDPQGAPSSDGHRYHSAVDWFAPGGTPVLAPVDGRVIETVPSRGTGGQVFGGVLKILDPDGRVWVLRHVDPLEGMEPGTEVPAGRLVASVTPWRDGGPHLHLEIWRTRAGSYNHQNMIDPRTVDWVPPLPPLAHGRTLRMVIDDGALTCAGWPTCAPLIRSAAAYGLNPRMAHSIAWRGQVWRGAKDVTNVCKSLNARYLEGR